MNDRSGSYRKMRGLVAAMLVMAAMVVVLVVAAMPVAADGPTDMRTTTMAAVNVMDTAFLLPVLLLIFGFGGAVGAAVSYKDMKPKQKAIAVSLVAVLLTAGIVGTGAYIVNTGIDVGVNCTYTPNDPRCITLPPNYVPIWDIQIPATVQGGGRDIASEFPAGGSWTVACSAIPGQGTSTIDAYTGTITATVDRTNKRHVIGITVNTALAITAAGFSAPDCHSNDYQFQLANPVDKNGDGTDDSISLWARLVSWSGSGTMTDGNNSVPNQIIYRDNTNGWWIGVMQEDADQAGTGVYASFFPAAVSPTSLPTSSGFVRLGSNTGSTVEYFGIWEGLRNYGPWGYTQPDTSYTYQETYEFCTPINGACNTSVPGATSTWTYTIRLAART